MQCEEVREQFAEYVNGNVERAIPFEIAQHLEGCQLCRVELNELKSLWAELGNIPRAAPTPDIRTRFNEMLDAYTQPSQHTASAWRRRMLQISLAAAVLVMGIGIGYHIRPSAVPNTELAELRSELYETRQMVALSLMQQQAATDRLKGINWSSQLQQPSAELLRALLDTLMHDPNVNVRLATVDALRQFGQQPVVRRGLVEAMVRQQSPMVEISLIDLAVDLREKESIGTLQQLSRDQTLDQSVRERAQRGLMELE
jgi:hypothetical protein